MGVSGSIRTVTIDGIPFNVTGDANITLNPRIEKEAMPHSGGNEIKHTLVAANAEGIDITASTAEYDILKSISERLDNYPLSFTKADGSSFKTEGQIDLQGYESEANKVTVLLLTSTGVWEAFAV